MLSHVSELKVIFCRPIRNFTCRDGLVLDGRIDLDLPEMSVAALLVVCLHCDLKVSSRVIKHLLQLNI